MEISCNTCQCRWISRLPLNVIDNENIDGFDYFKFVQMGCCTFKSTNIKCETKKDIILSIVLKYVGQQK